MSARRRPSVSIAKRSRPRRRARKRWSAISSARRGSGGDGVRGDARPDAVRSTPANKLAPAEYAEVMATVHRPEYASLPPGRIVAALADAEQHRRGRSQPPRRTGPATTPTAQGPNEVWSADISWWPARVRGLFFMSTSCSTSTAARSSPARSSTPKTAPR